MNFYQENNIEQDQIISDNKNNRQNLNYAEVSEINTPISKKMIADGNIYSNRIIKPLKTFVYKSIFHNGKNNNNKNIDMSNKKHYEYNLSNQKLQNQINHTIKQDYNFYNHNTFELDISKNILNNEHNNTYIINLNTIEKPFINDI